MAAGRPIIQGLSSSAETSHPTGVFTPLVLWIFSSLLGSLLCSPSMYAKKNPLAALCLTSKRGGSCCSTARRDGPGAHVVASSAIAANTTIMTEAPFVSVLLDDLAGKATVCHQVRKPHLALLLLWALLFCHKPQKRRKLLSVCFG